MNPTVILRDARTNRWLRFAQPLQIVTTRDRREVLPSLTAIEARVNAEGLHAAGFLSYNAAPAFDRALTARRDDTTPLLWFGLFQAPDIVAAPPQIAPSAPLAWTPTITRSDYDAAIAAIKQHIADGDTYQVNYTFRLRARTTAAPWDLFRELVHAQDAAYPAYIDTGALAICSVSPELFFTLDGRSLISRPMKGTSPRGRFPAEDIGRAAWLRTSEKNRAENVMIVDMIRNDIGRVADVGTVAATELFAVERYPTLWQMTSTVSGQTGASVAEILTALFPCASITAAPKARTTEIIAALETTPRGVYTGAIGYIAPDRHAQFNVAIRTVTIDTATGIAEYGVGGGVTWESDAGDEYDECVTKARVLTERHPDFSLLETLRWDPADGYRWLDRHLDRMLASADYFSIPADRSTLLAALDDMARSFAPVSQRVRCTVTRSGSPHCSAAPLVDLAVPVRLQLAPAPVDSSDVFLFHKTTHRDVYDRARGACAEADDVVLWNARGEITETSIANVAVEIGGRLCTPPVACGLLGGLERAAMLEEGTLAERVITVEEFAASPRLYVLNSVRGLLPATLVGAPS